MRRVRLAGVASLLLIAVSSAAPTPDAGSPEDVVRRYLTALKGGNFDAAYDLISKAMKQGKDREVWVKEQRAMMAVADVKIFEFTVYPGKIEGDVARVPNVLSSQDRFLNTLGLDEHELYTLVREEGAWKVDRQVIVDPPDLRKWFPSRGTSTSAPSAPPSH
jgi:hypothetical protein